MKMEIRFVHILMFAILLLGTFLRFYNLHKWMFFIGDFGWFYLSARDMLLHGTFPLVGITSSHIWLHQGALWTYCLAFMLWIFRFNPVSGAYLPIVLSIASIYLLYKTGSEMFSERVGLIAALLFATSPLAIVFSRMPYHTSPIPFFAILFIWFVYKWIKGNIWYVPFIILILTILYSFELATILFAFAFFSILGYGVITQKTWANVFQAKIIVVSILCFIIPMLPMLLYDVHHGFPQTILYAAWIGYQFLKVFGIQLKKTSVPPESFFSVFSFFFLQYQRFAFLPNIIIAAILFFASILGNVFIWFKLKTEDRSNYILVYFISFILLAGFFFARTISEAYLPMLFPYLILLLSLVIDYCLHFRSVRYVVVGLLLLTVCLNIYNLFKKDYFVTFSKNKEGWAYGPGLETRIHETKAIISDAGIRDFAFQRGGTYSVFGTTSIDNYLYLLWWQGGKLNSNSKLKYTIYQSNEGKNKKTVYLDDFVRITKKD